MIINEVVSKYRNIINKSLSQIYSNGPTSLTKPINYVLNGQGKRLRPLLTIFSAEACGAKIDDVLNSALAIEVLHNFTLVHDDIMDQDQLRHGKTTVHKKWDDGIAILTGDAMLSLALKLINKSPIENNANMQLFIDGLLAVCEGQAIDKEFESKTQVMLDDYIKMIDLKTGYMIGLSSHIGATTAGADENTSKAIRDFGRLIGRAFQIQDDLLEIFSNSDKMGKSLKSDILLGKKTYLMIKAIEKNSNIINEIINLTKKDYTHGINKVREFMVSEGIKEHTLNEINNIIMLADAKIDNLDINKDMLKYFSSLIKERGY